MCTKCVIPRDLDLTKLALRVVDDGWGGDLLEYPVSLPVRIAGQGNPCHPADTRWVGNTALVSFREEYHG